jgi:hypothetical protein
LIDLVTVFVTVVFIFGAVTPLPHFFVGFCLLGRGCSIFADRPKYRAVLPEPNRAVEAIENDVSWKKAHDFCVARQETRCYVDNNRQFERPPFFTVHPFKKCKKGRIELAKGQQQVEKRNRGSTYPTI